MTSIDLNTATAEALKRKADEDGIEVADLVAGLLEWANDDLVREIERMAVLRWFQQVQEHVEQIAATVASIPAAAPFQPGGFDLEGEEFVGFGILPLEGAPEGETLH
jgi:hypothetical protein